MWKFRIVSDDRLPASAQAQELCSRAGKIALERHYMPGIFGGVGYQPDVYEALKREFSAPWGNCQSVHISGGMLGGHAFGTGLSLHVLADGLHYAVDGEASIYRLAHEFALQREPALFRISSSELDLASACKGNVAVVDPKSGEWYLATECTGSFPLYYLHADGGLLFSSRLRPLAKIRGTCPDPIAILELLRYQYMLAGRSHYRNIRRLMPGQSLSYDPAQNRLRLRETSGVWATLEEGRLSRRNYPVDIVWDTLTGAVQRCLTQDQQHALMMSGGWDSRTLLAAMREYVSPDRLLAYSHGDPSSYELRLGERICRASGIKFRQEPINDDAYDLELLQRGFDRVENVVFPEWHRAGALLAAFGVNCVSSGLYGEVLGGRYGRAGLLRGGRKVLVTAVPLLNLPPRLFGAFLGGVQEVRDFLSVRRLEKPWYVGRTFWESIPDAAQQINADIDSALRRLTDRGITNSDQLIEAFITEHRVAQHSNAQTLSCRAYLDIAMPFADRDLLTLAGMIPVTTKLNNFLNRDMLHRYAPDLLRFPCLATLVPAGAPLLVQEAGKLVRRLLETSNWRLHVATGYRIKSLQLAWWNLEFLCNGRALNRLADNLRSELWDRDAIRTFITDIVRRDLTLDSIARLSVDLLRAYTVDLMLK